MAERMEKIHHSWRIYKRNCQPVFILTLPIWKFPSVASLDWHIVERICYKSNKASVATKIENGPKTNMKILRFLKMDRRWIRRFFGFWKWTKYEESSLIINSKNLRRLKNLRRSSKIENSSNIFEDTKIFKVKWKIFVVKIFFQSATWTNFLSSRT